ncbi:MAG: 50S ribosomal protein L9 [Candidatus Buchananbacteria bacterium]|jgi:large subunit ribosomal protein L9
MKILFVKDVKGTAKRGEIKDVAEGYGLNFLIPQGFAVMSTPENMAKMKRESEKKVKTKEKVIDQSKVLADKIKGKRIEIKAKANEAGKLYASVSEAEVKSALKLKGFDIRDAKVIFPTHIKEAGDFEVTLDFGAGIQSSIIILVRV